jgi:hypothetical protein
MTLKDEKGYGRKPSFPRFYARVRGEVLRKKDKVHPKSAMKAQRGRTGIALLFL